MKNENTAANPGPFMKLEQDRVLCKEHSQPGNPQLWTSSDLTLFRSDPKYPLGEKSQERTPCRLSLYQNAKVRLGRGTNSIRASQRLLVR